MRSVTITEAHYSKSELSTNKDHPNDVVHVFKIQEDLMPRFVENSSYENVCIYVKITWPDGMKPMFIISFHFMKMKSRILHSNCIIRQN